jgi:3-deoxy-D-manno-octulosonate 8-phosphate phosphatase (KDO 8-P phosphatase)
MPSQSLSAIKGIVTDIDGVLTDGTIVFSAESEKRAFHVFDGLGFLMARHLGWKVAFCSGRDSLDVRRRAESLQLQGLKLGRLDKGAAFFELLDEWNLKAEQVAYLGDDLIDLAPLRVAGAAFCPLTAHSEVKQVAEVLPLPGGTGVFRAVVERIAQAQGLWPELLRAIEGGMP